MRTQAPSTLQFIATDRDSIEHGLLIHSPYVVISIHDPDKRRAIIPKHPNLRDVLYLAFHDAAPVPGRDLPDCIMPMTADQARQAWAFVRKWEQQVDTVVVQCQEGMCRSPAMAAALSRFYGGDWESFFHDYQPTHHVYSTMLQTYTPS